jgi:hypothetical protein
MSTSASPASRGAIASRRWCRVSFDGRPSSDEFLRGDSLFRTVQTEEQFRRTLTTIAAVCCQSDEKILSMRVGPAWKTGKVPPSVSGLCPSYQAGPHPPLHPQLSVLFATHMRI